jgi:hypothetical protein
MGYSLNDPQIDEQLRYIYAHPEQGKMEAFIFVMCVMSLFIFVGYKIIPAMLNKYRMA